MAIRNRTSLKFKFALLLTAFVVTTGSIIGLYSNTSKKVTAELSGVEGTDFPRFSETTNLSARFEEITRLFEDAVLTGEDVLLERAQEEKTLFEACLRNLNQKYPSSADSTVSAIEKNFHQYFFAAHELAILLLDQQSTELAQMAGFQDKSMIVSGLKKELEADLGQLLEHSNTQVQASLRSSRQEIRDILVRTLVIGLAASMLIFIFLVYLSRRIIVPISTLSKMTAKVARGNFEEGREILFLGNDEVGELARSFNTMKKGLKDTTVSKAYVDNIIRSMADCLIVLDKEFSIVTVNNACIRLLDYRNRDDLIGKHIDKVFSGEKFSDWTKREGLFSREMIRERARELVTSGGEKIPVIFSASLLENEEGLQEGIVCVAQDITDLKNAEAELEARAAELSRSNADLEQFAYVASHDLQEPLRMVVSYLQLLERRYKGKLDENADEFINFAVDGAVRMKGLINDLLTYSRVGTSPEEMREVDCTDVLKGTLRVLSASIEESRAVVTHDALPKVMAVETQLGQLLQNLIGNAIKYRGEAAPAIHVGAEKKDDFWEFSISDNSIGMEERYLERIFVIFQRLHTKEEYAGTGIGLAICKKIVEKHNGRIWVTSKPGQGSRFYFTLPSA
ncbi:ATP-binding protein [Fibrobacterota bacterium]